MTAPLKPGEVFEGKYEIQEILGQGGVGTVYKAMQVDCQRIVALKVLDRYATFDEEYKVRFLQEGKVLSNINHENIVTVYSLGLSTNASPYLVMEFLNGQSLRAVLNTMDRLPVLQALKIIRAAAGALSLVHKQGVVHRDLKPENMLIVSLPEPYTVKLVDFGLARMQNSSEQKLTATGQLIGTPAYMSPEQCSGQPADQRADIYSLGLCLYEMIVGKKPFEADSAVGFLYKQINETVPQIKDGQIDLFHPGINDLLSKCLAKNPENRCACMDDLVKEIDSLIDTLQAGRQISSSRNQLAIIGTVSIFLLIAVIVAVYIMKSASKKTEPDINRKRFSGQELSDANKNKRELLLRNALGRDERRFSTDSPELISSLETLAEIYSDKQEFANAEALLKRALAIREKNFPGTAGTARCLTTLALCCQYQNKHAAAEPYFKRSLAIIENLYGSNTENTLNRVAELAHCYRLQKKYSEAESMLKRACSIAEQTKTQAETRVKFQLQLADNYIEQGKTAAAEPLLKRAFEMSLSNYGPQAELTAKCLISLGSSYQSQKKFAQAVQYYEGALAIEEKRYGIKSEKLANLLVWLALSQQALGKYPEAESYYKRAMLIAENSPAPDPRGLANITGCLAGCYFLHGKYPEAEPLYKRCLELEPNAPNIAYTMSCLAICYKLQGKYSEAAPLFERLIAMNEKLSVHDQFMYQSLADCYRHLGKEQDAGKLESKAMSISK